MSIFLLAVAILTVAFLLVSCIKYRHGYWKRQGIPYIEPPSFLLGNLETLVGGQSVGIITAKFYRELKRRRAKFGGVFLLSNPAIVLVDLDLIKSILSKDSQYFIDRGVYYNEKHDALAADLFNIGGTRWRNVRVKISPNYTSGKMKAAFATMLECCQRMERALEKCAIVDVKELFCCYTTDVNFQCSFGFECNSLEDPKTSFRSYGKKFFGDDLWKQIKHTLSVGFPRLSRHLGVVTRHKEVTQFWHKLFLDAIRYREANNYHRDDLLQMLIAMKGEILTLDEVAAHSLLFFIASFETSSSAMTFCMYEIAKNVQIQQKIREEIKFFCKEGLTYDSVMSLKYLKQALEESMRKHPPIPTLNRECVKDYQVPGSDLVIKKGTQILISALGLHHDEDYFPNHDEFNPERFSDSNRGAIPSHAYLPFGEGPRNCVGALFIIIS